MTPKPEIRDGFRFRGGQVPLDLTATVSGRLRGAPKDALAIPADLDRWLVAADLVETSPAATADDLAHARDLREAAYRAAMAIVEGRPVADEDRTRLNDCAAQPAAAPQLDRDGSARLSGSVRDLLAVVAREAVNLFGGDQSGRIRQCEGPVCTVLFLDTSRHGGRRWCSMSACGNRAKVAEFRRREKDGDA
jgi:predicted RNA-binding Zn ribbon-like protein